MKYVIGLVVVAVVVGFLAVQFLFGPSTESDSTSDSTVEALEAANTEPTEPETFSGNGTITALLARNQPIECTVSHTAADSEVTGTVFMNDGQFRADMLQTSPGMTEPVLSSMILIDNTMYTWSMIDGEEYGVKMDLSEASDTSAGYDQGPIKADTSVSYTCKPWAVVDGSVFVPPTTVLFQDMSALMKTGMEYGTVYNEGEF